MRPREAGFTLVEVMMATLCFTAMMMGVLLGFTQLYKLNDRIRFRDQVSGLLQQLATEFTSGALSGNSPNLWSTTATSGGINIPTGSGITVAGFDQSTTSNGEVFGYRLTSRGGNDVNLAVTRVVEELDESTGTTPTTGGKGTANPAGRMKIATFTAKYSFLNKEYTQTISAVRNARFAD